MINFCAVGRRIAGVLNGGKGEAISFFDVKELYNMAYEQKAQVRASLKQYRRMEARARAMDEAYRAQLGLMRRAA